MKAYLNWSGGKDSALALYYARQSGIQPGCLSTNINAVHDRVSMHGVRRTLLEQQAKAIGLPLYTMDLPEQPGMSEYEKRNQEHVSLLKALGYTDAIFGDIFLQDLKDYRETQLAPLGVRCHFPLWKKDGKEIMEDFIRLGFKAVIVCVNENFLSRDFCGRLLDESFINDLPAGVDICGENGEYHSFVFDGPLFREPVPFSKGEVVRRSYPAPKSANDDCFTSPVKELGFYFLDLEPVV